MLTQEQYDSIKKNLRRGLAYIPAGVLELPHDELSREADELLICGMDRPMPKKFPTPANERDWKRFNRIGSILMSGLESLDLVTPLANVCTESFGIFYEAGASLADHIDQGDGTPQVRISYSFSGSACFASPSLGRLDTEPGSMIVQDLTRSVSHEIVHAYDPRLVGVWDMSATINR
jgi:hypothetical protein